MAAKKDYTPWLIGGGIALAYFGVLNPLLKFLGIKKDEEDIIIEKAENTAAWDTNFWKEPGIKKTILTNAGAEGFAKMIYQAFGFFNDSEEQIFAVFNKMKTQAQVSQLADKYFQLYKVDLYYELKDRLSDNEFATIIKIVNKLPKYLA